MDMPVKIYGPISSPSVCRVVVCLLEKDVHNFQLVPVNLAKGENKTPQYLKIQPFGQVPAFQDESVGLFETRAICRYVVDKYANQGNKTLHSNDLLVKSSIEKWIEAEAQDFNPPASALVNHLFFRAAGTPLDPNLVKTNKEKLAKVLDVYDTRLGESQYLAGGEFTLADLFHLPYCQLLAGDDESMFRSRKNVGRWWDDVSGRDSWKKVLEMQKQNA
ncbi:OLC1v1018314C1 [Oldenlandia corymbosa var. corymbosa]|uniref:glutathione transferase n=1 Tax=Oldenlandia corymbosa var. corymbosa TaxID=529605 RepID=A0AAV1EBM7_OLDCO|nr:OLC1v1018314C1 [Oldenlandia corymbosa var. corymbosa]